MKHNQTIWVLGGDLRQAHLARLLCQDGYIVHTFALDQSGVSDPALIHETTLDQLDSADVVILPMPISTKDANLFAPFSKQITSLDELLDHLKAQQLLLGGRLDPRTCAAARLRGLSILDYFAREELAVANCVPTAEGCLQLALEHLPITIHGCRILVLGYGRVARITAQRFAALGGQVTVAARKYDQFAWAQSAGHDILSIRHLSGNLDRFDLVVNTVPSIILGAQELQELSPDCLVIDLASFPGGVDREAAKELDRKVIWALSLPGSTAPVSAANIMRQTICHILHERGH